jgi:hypothetical protein
MERLARWVIKPYSIRAFDVSAERGGLVSSLHIKNMEYTTSWGIIWQ